MRRRPFRLLLSACVVFALCSVSDSATCAQTAGDSAAILKSIHAEGIKHLSEPQLIALSELTIGNPVGKPDLQAAADRLVQTGLFSSVNYVFQAKEEGGLFLTFKLVESPRILAYFDNFPWFTEAELAEAIKKELPFYDGTLPEAGATVDRVAAILGELTASRGMHTAVEHQVIANPIGEGTVQEFRIADVVLQISKVEFGDPGLAANKTVRQHLDEVQGKAYSRMMIDLFLAEQVRPIYLQQGFLRVKLGPPEIRLSGNPNQKLPDQIPVFVPVTPGPVYKWKGAQWTGNTALSVFTLNNLISLKTGDVANGMTLEAAWDRMQEEYGHLGYLDARVEAEADFDDQAHTIYYRIKITEGRPYKFGKLVLTEISPAAERRLRAAWPILSDDVFDKTQFEDFLLKLQVHREQIFVDLPVHYDSIGHWLEKDASSGTVDVLMDFK